jgi:soluble lytic murein transglycosylase-like protein
MAAKAMRLAALALAVGAMFETAGVVHAGGPCEREMALAAEEFEVPLGVLYAVALTETGSGGSLAPWALNIEGRTVIARSREAALAAFGKARASGARLIDLGCMQVNHHYHGGAFRSVDDMLEPRANVRYAARFLRELHRRAGTWTAAVARYHAGPANTAAQARYICRVTRHLVAQGFGRWTPEAKAFCARAPA